MAESDHKDEVAPGDPPKDPPRHNPSRRSSESGGGEQQVPVAELIAELVHVRAEFAGPLPPPDILIRYNEAIPDGAERVFRMAESQSKHRQELEKFALKSDAHRANWGLACGFLIAMTVILLGAFLVVQRKTVTGTIFIGGAVVSLTSVFVIGTQSRKGERLKRVQMMLGRKGQDQGKVD